ncbi:MAG: glycoside hydrolase family 44 protein [Sedimentisphaerales bacterium]
MRYIAPILAVFVFCASVATANVSVTYNINTDVNRTPISKYIYGSNTGGNANYTVVRSGGNRLTAYNWENNYSNAGNDWQYSNDDYLCSSTTPGQYIINFCNPNVTNKQDSILTVQMAGYVSADGNGDVNLVTQTAPSSRFKNAVFVKGAPFTLNPVTTDANVYMDEFVNFVVNKYGHAGDPNGVKFYCMDNEPDLWASTHPEVHPKDTNCAEYKDKSVAISLAVKNVDPNAQMLGPVSYGFNGYYSFQDACDWKAPLSNGYSWFLDYYLAKMDANSSVAGKRLLDALDVHWYPEAQDTPNFTDGNRITNDIRTTAMYNARMQAPRTLWDTSYVGANGENSWINQWYSSYLPIIPRIQKSINTYYPDTNLTITEYAYGAQTHWSGGIATADVLGIFGKYGVYLASYWFDNGPAPYVDAAIKIYTNYDNNKSTFGNTEVYSADSNKVESSIYASVFDGYTCELHLIVINKDINNPITGTFNITSPQTFTSGNVWKFDSNDPNITATTPISSITGNSFTYTIPATTVCHIVLQASPPTWDLTGPSGVPDCHVNIWDLKDFTSTWLNSYTFVDFAYFAQEWGT